jgi:hypothetical protein
MTHPRFSMSVLRTAALLLVAWLMAGCAITVKRPANNEVVLLPAPADVVVTSNASFTNLRVAIDGTDVSGQMTMTGTSQAGGQFTLPAGNHTVTASANVSCWFCTGGVSASSDSRSFVVANQSVCARNGILPITLGPDIVTVGHTPGRREIAYRLQNNSDVILIIVDDAPGLSPTQMRLEVDIDPVGMTGYSGVTAPKIIEAWPSCHTGNRVGEVEGMMKPGIDIGTCQTLSSANDLRSGCTNTTTLVIDQATTSELWLRKPGILGIWGDAEGIDSSIWQAFGGRSLRFIWRYSP